LFKGINRSVKDLFFNFFENIFVLDNKLLTTLKYLLFYPGKLTKEYANGRIASYVHPSKLFWFISIIFFALLTSQINWSAFKDVDFTEEKIENMKEDLTDEEVRAMQIMVRGKEMTDTGWIKSVFSTYGPYVSFVMIPFFAFCLLLFFRKRSRYYVDHLTFALHFHAFIFLILSIYILLLKVLPSFRISDWVTLYIPLIYLAIAMHNFYRPKLFSLVWKYGLFSITYAFGLLMVFALCLAAIALIFFQ